MRLSDIFEVQGSNFNVILMIQGTGKCVSFNFFYSLVCNTFSFFSLSLSLFFSLSLGTASGIL